MTGRTQSMRLLHQPERQRGGDNITDAGHKADQAVEAKSELDSWNNESSVEQRRQHFETRDAFRTRASTWRREIEGGCASAESDHVR
jgi:hypothetical protein